MATQEMWNSSVLASLKSAVATLVVIFFFTVFNIDVPLAIVPLSIVAVFLLCCLLYYRELFYFFTKNPTVFIYPLIAVISATWSIAPSKTVWYAFQLCITVGGAKPTSAADQQPCQEWAALTKPANVERKPTCQGPRYIARS